MIVIVILIILISVMCITDAEFGYQTKQWFKRIINKIQNAINNFTKGL